MAQPTEPEKVKLICGMISAFEELFERAKTRMAQRYGTADSESETIPFRYTAYYEQSMGKNLLRKFISFKQLIAPAQIVPIKLFTNELEKELSEGYDVDRAINLDPGYMTLAKLVLASCKGSAHRIYLQDGVYAEVTLYHHNGDFVPTLFTFPDYRTAEYREYLRSVRTIYKTQLRSSL